MFEDHLPQGNLDAVRLKINSSSPPLPPTFERSETTTRSWPERRKQRRPFWLRWKFWLLLIVLGLAGIVLWYGVWAVNLARKVFQDKNPFAIFTSFGQLITGGDRRLTGEDQGEVNVLLLGIGGEGHEGALLTDTIILATIRPPGGSPDHGELSLVSIPRDYQAQLPSGLEWRKINSAYAYGELGGKKLGAQWAREVVENLTGLPIPYYALIDFSGFKKAIDDLGGIDVMVERSFSDSQYPDYSHGYLPTIRFEKGVQHFNGERALQFSRSRHGTNGEGSDFARSRRQEQVLTTMKDKALKLKLATDLGTISKLLEDFANHFRTNLEPWELKRMYELIRPIERHNVFTLSLDPTTGLICSQIAPDSGAYILAECPGKTQKDLRNFFANKLTLARLLKESPRLQIQNSTKASGLAQKAKWAVQTSYLEISIANYPGGEVAPQTILYDLTGGSKPETRRYMEQQFGPATTSTYPTPEKLSQPQPDFVVVLGADAVEKFSHIQPPKAPTRPVREPQESNNQ